MTWRAAIVVLGCALGPACGDGAGQADDPLAPASGSRLALQRYRFDDGTELVTSGEFYDTLLHTRCTPQTWFDGARRCVPVADEALYRDPACSVPIGVNRAIARPTYFVAHDTRPDGPDPRVFRAGAIGASLVAAYSRVAGYCTGPSPIPMGVAAFFELGAELDRDELVAFHDSELGDDRLGVRLRLGADGLRVPAGLRDRMLDADCTPRRRSDGSVVCEPSDITPASYYADASCSTPVAAVDLTAPPSPAPALTRITEPSGCASYYRVAGEAVPPVYQRDGAGCARAALSEYWRFALGTRVTLAGLPRAVEAGGGRRLGRVLLDAGGLTIADDRLFDRQIGVDCQPRMLRDAIRCVPTNLVTANLQLYRDAACTSPVLTAEVPAHSCDPPLYAATTRPFQIRAIRGIAAGPLYRTDHTCQPYAAAPGNELRELGDVLDLATLPSAIYYSER